MGSTNPKGGFAHSLGHPPHPPHSPYSPYSPYAAFHLPSDSSSESGGDGGDDNDDDDDDGDSDLPFPTALSRKDFLAPTFDATAYLSSLFPSEDGSSTVAQRHQTLEDLRTELRERSSAISAELLELVNVNYTSFLGLGDELKGGDEKVEDVRVALFGFRRSVEAVHARVRERRVAVGGACHELGSVRTSIHTARQMLELDERVAQLEDRLAIAGTPTKDGDIGGDRGDRGDVDDQVWGLEDSDEEGDNEDDEDDENNGVGYVASGPRKLAGLARDLVLASRLADALGHHIPFVRKMDDRLAACQGTLLLDLNAATKEACKASKSASAQARLLKLLAVYRVLDREDEIVRVLKET